MKIYFFREDGVFLNESDFAQENGWPSNSTPTSPLPIPDGHYALWSSPSWLYIAGEVPQYPPVDEVKAENKDQAEKLLQEVDFTRYDDVGDPTNPPYLLNVEDFKIYRQQLRSIAVNPPGTPADFPSKPKEAWSE